MCFLKESWVLRNWFFWTVMLEKIFESPLDCKEIQLVSPKGNQPWIFFGRTDAEAETPILWPPDEKKWLLGRDQDAGKDWRQEEKGTTEFETVGWHHGLNGPESEQAPWAADGQGGLVRCSPWGCKELDTTEQLKLRLLSIQRYSALIIFENSSWNNVPVAGLIQNKQTAQLTMWVGHTGKLM